MAADAIVSFVSVACFLASLPGPPGGLFHEAYFQVLPVWRGNKLCPTINPKKDVGFHLHTRENGGKAEYLEVRNDRLLHASTFNTSRPTVIYIHGYLEAAVALSSNVIKDSYMTRGGYNIILVDYRRLAAGPWYVTAVSNSMAVGSYVARFIDYLVSRGMRLSSLHVVGLSMGAQVAGAVGRNVKSGRLPRITGLDPAGPVFDILPVNHRLDPSCADFVDIIHTDRGLFGQKIPSGHADFYPNGGRGTQPGCKLNAIDARQGSPIEKLFCSHWRAFQLYAESVANPKAFPAVSCGVGRSYREKDCRDSGVLKVYMGLATPNTARGFYFVQTSNKSPYSIQATSAMIK